MLETILQIKNILYGPHDKWIFNIQSPVGVPTYEYTHTHEVPSRPSGVISVCQQ